MSELTTTTTTPTPVATTPSTPVESTSTSVEAAIESSIADHPDREVEASSTPEPTPTETLSATPEEIDELAKALGIEAAAGNGKWKSRIPYSKISKVVKEREAAAKAAHEAALNEHTTRLTDYEKRLEAIAQVEQIMFNEPEKFVEMLSQVPGYQNYFGSKQQTPRQPQSSRPGPDIRYGDGSVGYSDEGLQKLLDWNAQQVEARLTQRIAPFEQERQARAFEQAAIPKVQAQIAEARKWPMFSESEGEILKVLQSDPRVSLEAAYQRVVIPKLASDRDKVRAEVLAELNQRPHSTSVTRSTATKDEPVYTDIEDVIRNSIKGL